MSRASYLILIAFAANACTPQGDGIKIRRAETKLALPRGAEPLSSYNRFYAISGNSARGVFIWSPSGPGKMTIVDTEKDLPFVIDGGCDVIRVQLDITNGVWKHVMCHGP